MRSLSPRRRLKRSGRQMDGAIARDTADPRLSAAIPGSVEDRAEVIAVENPFLPPEWLAMKSSSSSSFRGEMAADS